MENGKNKEEMLLEADDNVFVEFKTKKKQKSHQGHPEIRLYKRRFLMLGIFSVYSMSSAFQWIEYAIITNIITKYYGVSELAVQWTSMVYMASYIPLMFVATWMLDRWGLRKVVLFGATLNAVGSLIKIGSVQPHLFALSFIGQTVAACAQSFVLEIPPKVASVWFGPSEVSTATAIGVFGNQLGVAIGFLLPPVIVPDSDDMELVGHQLRVLFIGSAVVCTAVLILAFAVFRDHPPHPPSIARKLSVAAELSNKEAHSNSLSNYKRSLGVLLKNVPFLLLLATYGINTGTYYAIGTLLNPIMLPYHPDAGKAIGEIGLTMVVAGLGGSVLCGYFLDRTKLFKVTTVVIYALSMAFMFVFTFTLQLKLLWLDYLTIGVLGFFMTGYLPIGFEFAAEITYPESEATSSGFLNVSAQFFGILFTLAAGELMKSSILTANLFMSIALLVGTVLTALIKENLKRQKANKSSIEKPDTSLSTHAENGQLPTNQTSSAFLGDEDALVRLTSNSSCYSTGGDC
ncbi:choline/ethanolamine transporter flvcr2a-like [Styela clava]